MTFRVFALLFYLASATVSIAAEMGYTYRVTELKSRPFTDAPTVASLPEKTSVEVLERKGAWMQIKAQEGGTRGWVRMLSVRLGSTEKKSSNGSLLALIGMSNRPRPQTSATVTTGVRGFSEEDLQKAEPNPEELIKMDGFAATAEQAQQFATAGKLESQTAPYFDADGKPAEAHK